MQGSRSVMLGTLLVLAAWSGIADRPSRAALVYFAEGGAAQLPAEIDGEAVRLIGPAGPVAFLVEDFRKIVPGHWPDDEWPSRRDRAESGDALERYRAAWWALEHGLVPEAVAMLRSSHDADPSRQPVARLVALLDRLDRPARSPDLASLRGTLPGTFAAAEGPRIVLLHQHDPAEAEARLGLLDRVLTAFYLAFEAQGFALKTPSEKLVAVWFAEQVDYRSYIRKEAGPAFLTTRGYYHPSRRVVFFDDGRSRADYRRSEAALRDRSEELDRAEDALSASPPGARIRLELAGDRPHALGRAEAERAVARLRREAAREALLGELDRIQVDDGAAVHELVHQLVIASGLAPRYDRFPIWLHEGLAMQFEAFRGGRWAGIGPVPGHRLDQWRRLPSAPPLEPLLRDEGFGRGYDPGRYAASWALVSFLRGRHPAGFVAFLDQLRNPRAGAAGDPGALALASFRDAIGSDLGRIRGDWAADLGSARSPLEAHAPSGPGDRGVLP